MLLRESTSEMQVLNLSAVRGSQRFDAWTFPRLEPLDVAGQVAVVGVLVWMLAVEQIVIPAYPAVGRWMPGGATWALLQIGPSISLDGKLLSASAGGVVLVGYTAAAVALALLVTPKRDVL